jgi:hypothetical protein
MKRWAELTDEQRANATRWLDYLLGDQWWIDMITDCPDLVNADLRQHGYDPDSMTMAEKVHALNNLPAEGE